MQTFKISPPDSALTFALHQKIVHKTKPVGALGYLEDLALQIGLIQNTLTPQLNKPAVLVFAGDHGIAESGVSPYPQAVTAQMVLNFLAGGAAINVFAKQNNMQMRIVDAGVNFQFAPHADLINAKIGMGTANFLYEPAMSEAQCEQALTVGARLVKMEIDAGCNVISFGEMGIANTSSASCLMSVLCDLPIEACVGRGTGLDDAGLIKKTGVLKQAINRHMLVSHLSTPSASSSTIQTLAVFGGFEIAMMVGAMLAAAEQKALLLIDGFIATTAILLAAKMQPDILHYCIFAHCSNENAHSKLLDYLGAKPLLDLGLRLGEGTGAVLAYPLIQASVNFLNDMASFESAGISDKA